MVRKQIGKQLSIVTVVLLLLVFIIGILVGRNLTVNTAEDVSKLIKENELNTESYILEQGMLQDFEEGKCELAKKRIEQLSTELYTIGKNLNNPETINKIGETNYNLLKRKYHLTQLKTYLFFYKIISNCHENTNVILFYFGKNDRASEDQGKILDMTVQNYNVSVFAIEYNYSAELNFLEEYYKINTTPSIIVNYQTKNSGLTSYEDIVKELK